MDRDPAIVRKEILSEDHDTARVVVRRLDATLEAGEGLALWHDLAQVSWHYPAVALQLKEVVDCV